MNEKFADFAEHYNTVILPTNSRKPRDKALVEGAVRVLYISVYVPLRDKIFVDSSIADAVLDRLLHNSHRIELKGQSMRRIIKSKNQK